VLEVSTDFIHWTPEVEITADPNGNTTSPILAWPRTRKSSTA